MKKTKISALITITCMVLGATPSSAAEIRWARGTADGNFIGNFTDPANWDGGVVPGIADRARVDRSQTEMTLDSTIVVNDFLWGVDEEPQTFNFLAGADVTTVDNFIAGLNRGLINLNVDEGASINVGNNFLLGNLTTCCGGLTLFDSDITATVSGDIVVTDTMIMGNAFDGTPILTDVLLDVTSTGTVTANNIAFSPPGPGGDLAAYLAAGNTYRVNIAEGGLVALRGDLVGQIEAQIDEGFYTTDSLDGSLRAVFDADAGLTLISVGTAPECDFDGDDLCNGVDADLLVAEIVAGTNDDLFDLNGDGSVDQGDLDVWLTAAGEANLGAGRAYLLGDANLDGVVDGQDFVAWNGNKFTTLAAWTGGDFTANGVVDGQDFVLWNANKFTSSDLAAVPEPSGLLFLLAAFVGLARVRRTAATS